MVLLLFSKFLNYFRNGLVSEQLHVKIDDLEMSRALAKESIATYYKLSSAVKLNSHLNGCLLILNHLLIDYKTFTTFSDGKYLLYSYNSQLVSIYIEIWNFGVVVWEVFSYGMVPYKVLRIYWYVHT